VKDEVGLDIEVISAEQEAHLAFFSVQRGFKLDGIDAAIADIGGGSTEIILSSGNIVEAVCATPLGAVRLSEMFAGPEGQIGDDYPRMIAWIDRELRRRTKHAILRPHLLIGSGGTFTSLAEMVAASKGQVLANVRGYEVTRAEVSHLADRLRKLPLRARKNLPGLSPDRADIIPAGVIIIDRLMQHFEINRVRIHDRGVRDGLLLTMIDRSLGRPSENPHDQEAAIERFAVSCRTDIEHGRQVAKLAGMMLSQLIGRFELTPKDRPILEAASRLQDVGYLINYDQHHKHSYHLILNSRLAGFTPHDLELIANVARYHRGGLPKKKHGHFRRLSKLDRKRVRRLAGILRIAGGLDRSNSRNVQAVQLSGQDSALALRVFANDNPDVDIWAAQRRTELFEKAFDTKLSIEWHDPNKPASGGPGAGKADSTEAAATDGPHAATPPEAVLTEHASGDAAEASAADAAAQTDSPATANETTQPTITEPPAKGTKPREPKTAARRDRRR
jgi:exopolyphosphatase/guanosine-5'-triphosphate,3'-diphosphate pyrophosphatase